MAQWWAVSIRCQCALGLPANLVSPVQVPHTTLSALLSAVGDPDWRVREWVAVQMSTPTMGDVTGSGRLELQTLVRTQLFAPTAPSADAEILTTRLLDLWEHLRARLRADSHPFVRDAAATIAAFDPRTREPVFDLAARNAVLDTAAANVTSTLRAGIPPGSVSDLPLAYRNELTVHPSRDLVVPGSLLADPICRVRRQAVLRVDPPGVPEELVATLRRDPCEEVLWWVHQLYTADADQVPEHWNVPDRRDQPRTGEPVTTPGRWTVDVPGVELWVRLPDGVSPTAMGVRVLHRRDGSRWVREKDPVQMMALYGPPRRCRHCTSTSPEHTLWADPYDPGDGYHQSNVHLLTCQECPGRPDVLSVPVVRWSGTQWCYATTGTPVNPPDYLADRAVTVANTLPPVGVK
jgi:hypothetical protein